MKQTEAEIIAQAKERGAVFGLTANGFQNYLVFTPEEFQAFTTLTAAQPVQPAHYELAAIVDSTCGGNLAVQVVTTSIALRNGTGLYVRAQ